MAVLLGAQRHGKLLPAGELDAATKHLIATAGVDDATVTSTLSEASESDVVEPLVKYPVRCGTAGPTLFRGVHCYRWSCWLPAPSCADMLLFIKHNLKYVWLTF